MASRSPSKYIRPITSDEIIDNALGVNKEQQANLFNPSKFEGKLEYPAIVVHYFESGAPDGAFEYVNQKFGKYFFEYSENTERKYCVCYVEGEDGDSGPSSVIEEPYELRDKDPNKYVKVLTQLPKFKLAKNIADEIPYPGSRVTVRYYDTTLDSNPNIDGVVGEIISIEVLNGTPPEPLGTGGGSGKNLFAGKPTVTMELPKKTQADIDREAEAFDNPVLQEDPADPVPITDAGLTLINGLNPDFQKIIKSFMLNCWEQLGITITPTSAYRSLETQKNMRKKWVNNGSKGPAPADPDVSLSFHIGALAFDFNPKLADGKTLTSRDPGETWVASGIGNIIDQFGLQWGINFPTNYDPIHVDMSLILGWSGTDVSKFVKTAEEKGKSVQTWPVYEYINGPSVTAPSSTGPVTAYSETTLSDEESLADSRVLSAGE